MFLKGTEINDNLTGSKYNDHIYGLDGNDLIYGNSGNDIIEAGKGDDYIENYANSWDSNKDDTYIFNLGDGKDTILDNGGNDKIIFRSSIKQSDLLIELSENDLIIKILNFPDQITIKKISDSFTNNYRVEILEFSDGSIYNISHGLNLSGSNNDDTMIGTIFKDNLNGLGGKDYIYGSDDIDTINGGIGDDILKGGYGSDIYIFEQNYGNDIITDNEGTGDKIIFDINTKAGDIAITYSGNDLNISKKDSSDIITIRDFFYNDRNIETIEFESGTKFDLTKITKDSSSAITYSLTDYAILNEDTITKLKFLDSDNPKLDYSNISIVKNSDNIVSSIKQKGEIILTPKNDFYGDDQLTLSYINKYGSKIEKQINVFVNPINDSPIAKNLNLTTNEDTPLTILAADSALDIENDIMSFYSAKSLNGFIKIKNNDIIYTPNPDFYGTDIINFTVTDGKGAYSTSQAIIEVISVNDAPKLSNDTAQTYKNKPVVIDATENDTDVEDGFLEGKNIIINKQVVHGNITIEQNGTIIYTPNKDYFGTDSFSYSTIDSFGDISNIAKVNIDVIRGNTAPQKIENKDLTLLEDQTITFDINDYFYDPDGDSFKISNLYTNNGRTLILDNKISYTPNNNFNGKDNINLILTDSFGDKKITNITPFVIAVNDAPVAKNDNFIVNNNIPTQLAILSNDIDLEDILFINDVSDISSPLHGKISYNNENNTIIYTANISNSSFDDHFTYVIADSDGAKSQATVNIKIIKPLGIIGHSTDFLYGREDDDIFVFTTTKDSSRVDGHDYIYNFIEQQDKIKLGEEINIDSFDELDFTYVDNYTIVSAKNASNNFEFILNGIYRLSDQDFIWE